MRRFQISSWLLAVLVMLAAQARAAEPHYKFIKDITIGGGGGFYDTTCKGGGGYV